MVIEVRPLTLTELSTATGIRLVTKLSIDKEMRDYVGFCGHLLTVTGNEVGLIHQSAKDYLLLKSSDLNPELEFFRVGEEETNAEIAKPVLPTSIAVPLQTVQFSLWRYTIKLQIQRIY